VAWSVSTSARPDAAKAYASWRARDRADRGKRAVEGGRDLQVHARISGLGREQVRHVTPVPGRAHRAVDQHGSPPDDIGGVRYHLGEGVADQRAQQVPAATDGGLADPEHGAGEVLGHVLAHQAHHQGHRPEQPQRQRWTGGDEHVTAPLVQPRHQIGELLIVQPCHSLVPQQLFADPCSMSGNTEHDGKSCCTSSATRPRFDIEIKPRIASGSLRLGYSARLMNKPPD